MRRASLLTALFVSASLLIQASTAAADTPAQFTTVNVQAPKDSTVNGVRFSILHGKTEKVRGLDLGLLALSESGTLSGLSMVLGVNLVSKDMAGGAAFSLVNVHRGNDTGLNAAFVNSVNNAENAVDFGFINIAEGATMVDIGGLNVSNRSAVQLGFINITSKITGVQIGFINIAENGFLPVFPIFNVAKTD